MGMKVMFAFLIAISLFFTSGVEALAPDSTECTTEINLVVEEVDTSCGSYY